MHYLSLTIPIVIFWACLMIPSLMWVAQDARKRKKGFAVVVLCFFTFPYGILIWLLLRPDIPTELSEPVAGTETR